MKKICPLVKEECLEHGCHFYIHLTGNHPQTGQPVDEFDCAIAWMPILLVENARTMRGAQAAVESMRNEVVKRQDQLNAAVLQGVNHENALPHYGDGARDIPALPE